MFRRGKGRDSLRRTARQYRYRNVRHGEAGPATPRASSPRTRHRPGWAPMKLSLNSEPGTPMSTHQNHVSHVAYQSGSVQG